MFKNLYKALLKSVQINAPKRLVAKHLAKVALYDLKGIDSLEPNTFTKCLDLMIRMEALEKPIYVVSTFRTAKEQDTLYHQGRASEGKIVTNAQGLESYHQYGLAFDVAFETHNWNPPEGWWDELGREGELLGLTWGGSFGDVGHFSYHPGFTWKKLKPYFKHELN